MKNKILLLSLCIPAFFTSLAASAETYDDCILKGLDGVTSDFIAKQVVKSCENKYSKSASNESDVPEKPKSTTIEVGSSKKWKIPVPEDVLKLPVHDGRLMLIDSQKSE